MYYVKPSIPIENVIEFLGKICLDSNHSLIGETGLNRNFGVGDKQNGRHLVAPEQMFKQLGSIRPASQEAKQRPNEPALDRSGVRIDLPAWDWALRVK